MAIAAGLGGISAIELMRAGTHHHPVHPAHPGVPVSPDGGLRLGPVPGTVNPTPGTTGNITGDGIPPTSFPPYSQGTGTGPAGTPTVNNPSIVHHGHAAVGSPLHHPSATAPGLVNNSAGPTSGLVPGSVAHPLHSTGASHFGNSGTTSGVSGQHVSPGTGSTVPNAGPAPGHHSHPGVQPSPFLSNGAAGGQSSPSHPYSTPTHQATPEEIQAYLLSMSPEDRRKYVLDLMAQNNLKPSSNPAYQPDLSPSFWEKPTYNFNGQTLNVVSAAATAYAIAGQLGVNIADLGTYAGHLDDLSTTLMRYTSTLYDSVAKANAVFEGDDKLTTPLDSNDTTKDTSFYGYFKAITAPHVQTATNLVDALSPGESDNIRQTACSYWHAEETNLAMLGTTAKDPRSPMDQARYKWDPKADNGKGAPVDQSANYPSWYFDTTDPRSPYYKQ